MAELPELPILAYENEIVRTVRDNQVTVITAETGAGKSTQVPLMLLRAGIDANGVIGVTEPRRVAAITLAEWVAELHGTSLGETVGYQIRGERVSGQETRVRYMTEGILLRQMHSDIHLAGYSVLVFDEVHERGVNQDLILALAKRVIRERPDLKIVVMSATISAGDFATHFGGAPVISVPGRVFPVETRYLDETPYPRELREQFAETVEKIIAGETGDILAFFPDEKSIKQAYSDLEERNIRGIRILPLYGNQPPEEQKEVWKRGNFRRVILATNIAETSITIDGVRHVIDTGFIKQMTYVNAAMSALEVVQHSKAGCDQRKGRAGRTAAGLCWRLFSKDDFDERPDYTEPEIRRMSLDQVLLGLRCLGYSMDTVLGLEFMDPPPEERWREAGSRLKVLGALEQKGEVTEDGRKMNRMPVSPMLGRMILAAEAHECVEEIATIVSGFVARPVFVRPRGKEGEASQAHSRFYNRSSDALTLLKVWEKWLTAGENGGRNDWARDNFLSSRALRDIERNRAHLLGVLEEMGIELKSGRDEEKIRKAVAAGLIVNLCVAGGGHSYSWHGRSDIFIHPGSAVFGADPRLMVCAEIVETTKAFARGCTALIPEWMDELLPEAACEHVLEFRRNILGDEAVLRHSVWQGTKIRSQEIRQFTDEDLVEIGGLLSLDMVGALGLWSVIHPASEENREIWRAVLRARGLNQTGFYGMNATEIFRHAQFGELLRNVATEFTVKLRWAGVKTVEEFRKTDLRLKLEDFLTEKDAARVREETERILAMHREAAEKMERMRREYEERRHKEQEEHAARLVPLRDEIGALRERAERLPRKYEIMGRLRTAEDQFHWWDAETFVRRTVVEARLMIEREERNSTAGQELAAEIRKQALESFPNCPFCGGQWTLSDYSLECRAAHDLSRILRTDNRKSDVLGEFMTDRDERAALMTVDAVALTIGFNQTWQGKRFRKVDWKPNAFILPTGLVGEKEAILRDLQELRKAREELEALALRVKKAEESVGAGAMKRLTFKIKEGQAVAETGGAEYRSAYQEPYPSGGETWFCRIGRDLSMGARRVVEVHPEFKAGGISSDEDLEELRELLRETYPGLPPELLFTQ